MSESIERGAVLITGASTGIGEASALRLGRIGFRVFAGVRNEADAERLRRAASARLTPIRLDVTEGEEIAEASRTVASLAPNGLVGLVNNAGVALAGPLEFLPLDQLRRQLEVNVVGQLAVTQAFLPLLRRGRGRVVFMGSISGRSCLPFLGPYQTSKFAVEALADTLRMELQPWGIQVSVIEPAAIATPIWEKSVAVNDEVRRSLPAEAETLYGRSMDAVRRGALALGRRGAPAGEVAGAVEHALTAPRPKTRYLVGRDARVRAALELLPDRLRDRILLRQLSRLT
jgi:NAD(P)-dependent dehydrogenase (short-subunit alcohol dehydrogenase family)